LSRQFTVIVQKHNEHQGFKTRDAFGARRRTGSSYLEATFAMAIFRCWHILLFFAVWTTGVTFLHKAKKYKWLEVPNAMLPTQVSPLLFSGISKHFLP
jgi:hypothetical protein